MKIKPEQANDDEILTPYLQDDKSYITCPDCGADIINDGGPCFYCETNPHSSDEQKQAVIDKWAKHKFTPNNVEKQEYAKTHYIDHLIAAGKQYRSTRNVQVGFFLIECPHVKILRNYDSMFCHYCQSEIVGNSVGNLLVSLDRDGFLEAKGPLKVR